MKVSKEIMKGTPPEGAHRGERTAGGRRGNSGGAKTYREKNSKERKEGRKK